MQKHGTQGLSDNQDQLSQQSMANFNFIDEYVAESNEVDIEYIKQSALLRKRRYVDALFFGEIVDKKRHGKGVMKYKSGRVYEGDWKEDIRHGRGYERYENGNIYIGQFENGKAHG